MAIADDAGMGCVVDCEPKVLADDLRQVWGPLMLDDAALYWAESWTDGMGAHGSKLRSVPKSGGAVTTLVADMDTTGVVTSDETHLYWVRLTSSGYTIVRLAKSGGEPEIVAVAVPPGSGGFSPHIAVNGTRVYFTDGKRVVAAPKAGGAVVTVPASGSRDIAADDTDVYVLGGCETSWSVCRMPAAFDATMRLTAIGAEPVPGTSISLDPTTMFVVGSDADAWLISLARSGGAPKTLWTKKGVSLYEARVDARHVYFLPSGDWPIRVPKEGGTPQRVLAGVDVDALYPSWAKTFAIDETHVYVAEGGDRGRIVRIGKN